MVRRGPPQAVESLVEFAEGGMNTSKGNALIPAVAGS